jgi:hypothetical protein
MARKNPAAEDTPNPALPRQVIAYNCGRPWSGNKPDVSYVGTGEGASGGGFSSILGPGVYFATDEGIAERYLKYGGNRPTKHKVLIKTKGLYDPVMGTPRWLRDNLAALLEDVVRVGGFESRVQRSANGTIYNVRGQRRGEHGGGKIGAIFALLGPMEGRKALLKAGVTGAFEKLPDGSYEIAVYDTRAVTLLETTAMYDEAEAQQKDAEDELSSHQMSLDLYEGRLDEDLQEYERKYLQEAREYFQRKSVDDAGTPNMRRSNPAFDPETASPEFRAWFADASEHVKNADGSPKVFYRGQTAGGGALQARLVMDSFTTSPEVASIYSSQQGRFTDESNVFAAYLCLKNPLVIKYHFLTFYDVLTLVGYWDGKTPFDETVKILRHLSNRENAKALPSWHEPKKAITRNLMKLPAFSYQIKEAHEVDEDEPGVALGLSFDQLPLAQYLDIWDGAEFDDRDEQIRVSLAMAADTFAFVETPAFKRALETLGYDGAVYRDPFVADEAAQAMFGKDTLDLEGVKEAVRDYDWEDLNTDSVIWTYRPLAREQVWPVTRVREPLPNPRRRR